LSMVSGILILDLCTKWNRNLVDVRWVSLSLIFTALKKKLN